MLGFGDLPNRGVRQTGPAQAQLPGFRRYTPPSQFAFQAIAERVALRVGDGCLIRQRQADGSLLAVAAAHRDERQRRRLKELIRRQALAPPRGPWLRQALATGRPIRVPSPGNSADDEVGIVDELLAGEVIAVPLAAAEAVVVVLRDRASGPFGAREHAELEQIAAEALRELAGDADKEAPEEGWERERELLEATSVALWLTDTDHRTTYVNQATCELVGLPAEQIIGVPIAEFLSRPIAPAPKVFEGSVEAERLLLAADGTERWVSATSRPIFDAAGQCCGMLHTLNDVDERHGRETELRTRADVEHELRCFAETLLTESRKPAMAQAAVELVADQFGAAMAIVAEVSSDQSEFEVLACRSTPDDFDYSRWRGRHPLPANSPQRAAIEDGEPVIVRDFDRTSGYERGPVAKAIGASCAAYAPIADGGACIGVVRFEPHSISDGELELLDITARLLTARWPAGALA